MPTSCCVPQCNQQGFSTSTGEKVSYFSLPTLPLRRKQWIHAIRRKEGKFFRTTSATKVCSLHFRSEDLRKSLNGRIYVVEGGVPSKFAWSVPSPRKRKAPTVRPPLLINRKRVDYASSSEVTDSTSDSYNEPETIEIVSEQQELEETDSQTSHYIKTLEEELVKLKEELTKLREENCNLKEKLAAKEVEIESSSDKVFHLERFKSDADINFYTGFAEYRVFWSVYEFLDPGENCKNIRPRRSATNMQEDFYNSDSSDDEETTIKKGVPRKLLPSEEYFITMCRMRRGFSERHLANLYGVAQSTISRILISWINYMYLKFGQICIWPSKHVVISTMPADFKDKFPNTRVIIDCTEIFCEMPSSLLLNSELFSSYKNHVTLKGLIGIAPSGAITFVSQLYTGSISGREIVQRSGFLSQQFDQNDSVMADKGFTIDDLLPLGVSLNIPPFLGSDEQMSAEDVIKTQTIASLRIHVERAINKIKN